jgi:hypothetical protein
MPKISDSLATRYEEFQMKLLLLAVSALTVACASAAPETPAPVAPVQTQTAEAGLSMYEGTYALEAPTRVINLRVWVDKEGKLNGELVGMGQFTTFRPSTEHKFLHGNADDIWVLFTVENGRATSATMHQRGREISGPRT